MIDGRYEKEKLLGQGAFSEVWKVKDTQTGVTLALKIYNPTNGIDEDGNEMLTHEFALMVNANHKNLLRPLFFATWENRPYLILPYCEQGNIGKMVGKMTEDEAWKLLRDCASALNYLHAMNPPILHQDIKPANILLSDTGDYMLTDFGVSTQAKQSLSRVSNQEKELLSAGTISYMAPERFSRNNLPIMANDIYSLGSTAYEMLSGDLPFGNDGGLLQKKGADVPELPGNFSPLLKRTLEKCLEAEPWARPTARHLEEIAEEAVKNPASRNVIPESFNATTPDEVRQSQLDAAQAHQARPTVMGPQVESLIRGTVMGPAAEAPLNGTVMGPASGTNAANRYNSADPYNSANPYQSGNPYTSNSVQPQGNSKKWIWAVLALVAVIGIGAGAYFMFLNDEKQEAEMVVDPAEQQKQMEQLQQAEYGLAMALFNNKDSVETALNRMTELANKGNKDALFEVTRTYAFVPLDTESANRKKALGWELDENNCPVSESTKREAIVWLQKAVAEEVPNFHKCQYWLALCYLNGLGTDPDVVKSNLLLIQARSEAVKCNDDETKEKIEKTLHAITDKLSKQ